MFSAIPHYAGLKLPNFFFSKVGERNNTATGLSDILWADCRLVQHILMKQEQISIANEKRPSFDGIANFGSYCPNYRGLLLFAPPSLNGNIGAVNLIDRWRFRTPCDTRQ